MHRNFLPDKVRAACVVCTVAILAAMCGCAPRPDSSTDHTLQVVASTPILADLAQSIGGERAHVTSLVPAGADPHSYEPSLRNIRDIAYTDLAFTNGLMLEQNKLQRTIEANTPKSASVIPVAEKIEQYGGELKPMVEDASLDSLWLGLRAEGSKIGESTTLTPQKMVGPGQSSAFITETFGSVQQVANSRNRGADISRQGEREVSTGELGSLELPAQAHTHLTWAFGQKGHYEITFGARSESGVEVPSATFHFAVGEDAQKLAQSMGPKVTVLDAGHADITADFEHRRFTVRADPSGEKKGEGARYLDPARTVLEVPSRTLQDVPEGSRFRFLQGDNNHQVYLLAQAVLGKHVHGDTDPHFWHSVPDVEAAVQVMRDSMIRADPAGAVEYAANTQKLLHDLDSLDHDLHAIYSSLPVSAKNLITTHDGYRYLAETYGMKVAGFVSAAAGSEPSVQQRNRLRTTVEDLHIQALYTDRGAFSTTNVLNELAHDSGAQVCQLYSDTLDDAAPHYVDMMRANAHTIKECSNSLTHD